MRRLTTLTFVSFSLACGSAPNRHMEGSTTSSKPAVQRAAVTPEASTTDAAGPASESDSGAAASSAESTGAGSTPASPVEGVETPIAAATEVARLDAPIAFVAGQPILASEILQRWRHREPRKVNVYLQEFVTDRLVLLESGRIGIKINRAQVQTATAKAVEALERKISENGSGMDFETFVRQQLQMDPKDYLSRMSKEQATDLLAARCVRTWVLESERVQVRFIAVREQSLADDIMKQLSDGANFQELAAKYSVDPSAKDGGAMPPIVRASNSLLSRLAFATPIGQVGGPIEEGGAYLLLLAEARPDLVQGTWDEIAPVVEASLAERPIEEPEYWQWGDAMAERYSIDMKPFYEYVGEDVGS
ncbi:MAG: peptidyl-prolyl cis-trans isomerase C [Planctomycetota bacterium]|jgi:peptidyl-prolyl cis-trans isomerase C